MSDHLDLQVKRIHDKIQLLTRQVSLLQKENESLKNALQLSELEAEKCRKQVMEMDQRLSVAKMAAAEMKEEDKKEMEKKLNLYIREIERCIGMLQE